MTIASGRFVTYRDFQFKHKKSKYESAEGYAYPSANGADVENFPSHLQVLCKSSRRSEYRWVDFHSNFKKYLIGDTDISARQLCLKSLSAVRVVKAP